MEILTNFKFALIIAMLLAVPLNRKRLAVAYLAGILFIHHLVAYAAYPYFYTLGNAKLTWDLAWILFELPLVALLYLKIVLNFRLRCRILGGVSKRDMQVLILTVLYMLAHYAEFIDWNNGDVVMGRAMPYLIPTINLLIVATILKDWFQRIVDKTIIKLKAQGKGKSVFCGNATSKKGAQ